jgi:predicted DNA-binding protein
MTTEERDNFSLRMPKILKEALQAIAKPRGKTLNGLILDILWAYVELKRARGA